MLADIIEFFVNLLDTILSHLGVTTLLNNLLGYLDDWQQYTTTFNNYLSGVYFILGKPLVLYIVGAFGVIVTIKLIMAIIHLFSSFKP